MSLQDDYYDLEAMFRRMRKPNKADERAFERIWENFCQLEAEVDRLRALKTSMKNVVSILKGM